MIRGFTVYNFQFVLLSFSEDRFFLSRQYSTDEMLQNALRDYVLLDTLKIIILTNNPANKLQQGVTKEFKFPSVSSSVHPSDCSSVRISTINILLVLLWYYSGAVITVRVQPWLCKLLKHLFRWPWSSSHASVTEARPVLLNCCWLYCT